MTTTIARVCATSSTARTARQIVSPVLDSARAVLTTAVAPGQVFIPMHEAQTNRLTMPRVDPHSRQPSYKHAAVDVRRLEHWER